MKFQVGDSVLYTKHKVSEHPGPRAESVYPAPNGDHYSYDVTKYWRVSAVLDDETIEVETRRGKHHRLSAHDPHLHKPNPLFKIMHNRDFPRMA
ncbi:MAG: hypothetical protein GF398_00050 [Chitinivibrionales bacterium]|nr:hypothetical protein [Chitinivibrionales bacterium]